MASAELLKKMGTDSAKWAAEFRRVAKDLGYSDMDEGWLIGWFANAIEAGRGAGYTTGYSIGYGAGSDDS